jgi:serine/threonine protein kinase
MLVTEYVAGGVLEDALHPRGGSSSLGHLDRLKIAKDIAAGLTHIHSQSILHRDLKPANVLLAKIDGGLVAKVADVGLARTLHGARQHMSAMTGGGAGTPQYMSPEQWSDQVRSAPLCCSGSL